MRNKFVGILLMICMLLNMNVCIFASSGLTDKPDVTNLNYILKDKDGNIDSVITSGGSIEVTMTLENNTSSRTPYVVMLQILNNGNKVSLTSAKGELDPSDDENICLSDGFSSTETDFSNYSAEVYVWSDMNSMQPISTYSVLGSDNNDIYAYKIDNDLIYTNGNTSLLHRFDRSYSGTPRIRPVFYDLAATHTVTPSLSEVTGVKKSYNFKAISQLGSSKDYYLELFKTTDENDPKNADLKSIELPLATYQGAKRSQKPVMYPKFDKNITDYTIVVSPGSNFANSYSRSATLVLETVNPDASISRTPSGTLGANTNISVTYTVTSADATVTKDYKINYVITNTLSSLSINAIRNGYRPGGNVCCYSYQKGDDEVGIADANAPIVVQDGFYNSTDGNIKSTVSILEIDISAGPERIKHGILSLNKFQDKLTPPDGTLRLYKVDESINSASDITTIPQNDVHGYLGDEICSLVVHRRAGNQFDTYNINIGPDYYNSLKAAGKTKMYIALSGEAANSSSAFCSVFYNGTAENSSKFYYVTE